MLYLFIIIGLFILSILLSNCQNQTDDTYNNKKMNFENRIPRSSVDNTIYRQFIYFLSIDSRLWYWILSFTIRNRFERQAINCYYYSPLESGELWRIMSKDYSCVEFKTSRTPGPCELGHAGVISYHNAYQCDSIYNCGCCLNFGKWLHWLQYEISNLKSSKKIFINKIIGSYYRIIVVSKLESGILTSNVYLVKLRYTVKKSPKLVFLLIKI